MELSAKDIERNMRQFYLYAMRTLHFAARAAHSDRIRRAKKVLPFSNLSRRESKQLYEKDCLLAGETIFIVKGYEIVVQDNELADALNLLPEHRRDYLLLKFYLKWPDRVIAEVFSTYPTTVSYNRLAGLKKLREIYEQTSE